MSVCVYALREYMRGCLCVSVDVDVCEGGMCIPHHLYRSFLLNP